MDYKIGDKSLVYPNHWRWSYRDQNQLRGFKR